MSMKRSKQRSFSRGSGGGDDDNYFKRPEEPEKTWEQHMEGKDDSAFTPYAMQNRFEKGALIVHSKFGKGVVVDVDATHVQVLFQDAKRKLGHGVQAE
jgi:hypothetical protein